MPALPDGSTLPAAASPHEHYLVLYGRFAPAWQVTMQTTLFDYDPGTSVDTYAKPGFPSEAGVYDVAVTGASEYASLYDLTSR